jgi:hypothetical protein
MNLPAMPSEVGTSEGGGTEGLISEIKNFARLGEGGTKIVERGQGPGKYPSWRRPELELIFCPERFGHGTLSLVAFHFQHLARRPAAPGGPGLHVQRERCFERLIDIEGTPWRRN